MEIKIRKEQGRVSVTVFEVTGEINSNTSEQFLAEAQQHHANGMQNLLVDLTQVRYVSSAGIRALSTLFKLLRTDALTESEGAVYQGINDGTFKSRHLKLLNPPPNVRDTFKMAGVDMFLEIYDDLGVAVASF
jgi:anti-anti-sigma factor